MKSKSLSCNIAIIPPPAITKKAAAMSRLLKKHGGSFVLDGKNYFPHITLTKLDDPMRAKHSLLPLYDFSFPVNKIDLFQSGEHGTCRKLFATFYLQ